MASPMLEVKNQVMNFWSRISFSQRVLVAGLATVSIGIFFGLMFWINKPDFQTLYTKISPEDANSVVKSLQADKVNYKLEDNGTTILVPADKVYGLRIKMAGEGTLAGHGGFELFDQLKMGETNFVQQIKYQRALQGELARTISEFPAVDNVRVHLVIPQRSLFIEEQQKPSVSVVLKLVEGKKMEQKEINGIVNLLTMAIEGLTKERVAITDTTGRALFQPEDANSLQGMTTTQYDYKIMAQQALERRIEDLLTPISGPGHVMARVNVDMDYSHKTIHRKTSDPQSGVVISEQRSEQNVRGTAAIEGGNPEANFRGDGLNGTQSTQQSTNESRVTNFSYNTEEQNIIAAVGDVKRVTVAVVVDGTYTKDANGNNVFSALPAERIKEIEQLVSQAVGYDSSRGDTIKVSNMPFGNQIEDFQQNIGDVITEYALRLGKPLLNALLVFLFLVMVVRPVVMAIIRPKVEGEMLEGLEGLPMGEERLALVESSDEELDALAILEKIEDIKAHAIHLSEQNMDQAIGIIRQWLKPEAVAKAA